MGRLTAWIDLLADAITALMELHPGSLIHQELEAALRQTVQDESRCFRRVDESLTQFAFGYGNNVTRAEFTRRLGHKVTLCWGCADASSSSFYYYFFWYDGDGRRVRGGDGRPTKSASPSTGNRRGGLTRTTRSIKPSPRTCSSSRPTPSSSAPPSSIPTLSSPP